VLVARAAAEPEFRARVAAAHTALAPGIGVGGPVAETLQHCLVADGLRLSLLLSRPALTAGVTSIVRASPAGG
jgi:hypothetical protein